MVINGDNGYGDLMVMVIMVNGDSMVIYQH